MPQMAPTNWVLIISVVAFVVLVLHSLNYFSQPVLTPKQESAELCDEVWKW